MPMHTDRRSHRSICADITRMRSGSSGIPKPPQILPAPLAIDALARFGRYRDIMRPITFRHACTNTDRAVRLLYVMRLALSSTAVCFFLGHECASQLGRWIDVAERSWGRSAVLWAIIVCIVTTATSSAINY